MEIALSSGCFTGQEAEIERSQAKSVELSAHSPEILPDVMNAIESGGGRVLGIHCPCPSRGVGLNPGAEGEQWEATQRCILESAQIACQCSAEYILVHAFYCVPRTLPAADLARMQALQELFAGNLDLRDYLGSDTYALFKARTILNLKSILLILRRDFPRVKLVLENLNPRIGYGGILFQDVVDIAAALDGDVGICLDLGHLTLASAALDLDMTPDVQRAGDLITSIHVHDNFGGKFFVDRKWNADAPDPNLQDVDTHLPFLTSYRRSGPMNDFHVSADNSAFSAILKGGAHYADGSHDDLLQRAVPVDRLLALAPETAHWVLEFDSRYAPLHEILREYDLARRGDHPRLHRLAQVVQ